METAAFKAIKIFIADVGLLGTQKRTARFKN